MAITGFLSVPDIPGESQRAGHEGKIDVFGLAWGVDANQPVSTARGRRRSRANIENITFEKYYDASSPYLFLSSAQGKSFDEVVLHVRKDSGEAHLDYLVITMTNVIITDYEMYNGKEDTDVQICESVSMAAEKVKILYTVQSDDHSAGDEHEIEYDIAAGV